MRRDPLYGTRKSMSAGSASSVPPASARPAVKAIAKTAVGDAEFDMFEVLNFDGQVLRVRTPFALTLGEEVSLHVENIGRTIARVTAHAQEITELTIVTSGTAGAL